MILFSPSFMALFYQVFLYNFLFLKYLHVLLLFIVVDIKLREKTLNYETD